MRLELRLAVARDDRGTAAVRRRLLPDVSCARDFSPRLSRCTRLHRHAKPDATCRPHRGMGRRSTPGVTAHRLEQVGDLGFDETQPVPTVLACGTARSTIRNPAKSGSYTGGVSTHA